MQDLIEKYRQEFQKEYDDNKDKYLNFNHYYLLKFMEIDPCVTYDTLGSLLTVEEFNELGNLLKKQENIK